MEILAQLQALIASLTALSAQVVELQAKLADANAAVDAEKKVSYDQGFAAGVASVPVVGDPSKVFSQEDLDKAVAAGVAAFKADFLVKFQALEEADAALLKQTEALLV